MKPASEIIPLSVIEQFTRWLKISLNKWVQNEMITAKNTKFRNNRDGRIKASAFNLV